MSSRLFPPLSPSQKSGLFGDSGPTDRNPTMIEFSQYCTTMLDYMSTCIRGPEIITYCSTGGLYCEDDNTPVKINDNLVKCNATTVSLCPERYYCPDARTMIGCPTGHFCREGSTRPRPCVFLNAACPDRMMANPSTYTIATILLIMFVTFILLYEFFIYRRVKLEEFKFKEATEYKTIQALEQEAISPVASMIDSGSNYIPHPYPPSPSENENLSGTAQTGDSTSSMVISRLGVINWSGDGRGEGGETGGCVKRRGDWGGGVERNGNGKRDRERHQERNRERDKDKKGGGKFLHHTVGTADLPGESESSLAERMFHSVSRSFKMTHQNGFLSNPNDPLSCGRTNATTMTGTRSGPGSGSGQGQGVGGSGTFRFRQIEHPLDVDFCELNLTLKSTDQVILRNVCGSFRSGQITAIIGPSGAGKTSLLSLLRGQTYYAKIKGSLRVNRCSVESLQGYRDRVAYVPQEDILYDELTVEENILYSALLFNRRGLVQTLDLYPMVNHALELLGIKFICHSVVGSAERKGISGGQKRRVSVAVEMMKESDLFLLDEPTSGLDSGTSISLMNCLHSLASLGTNIVATLHQPRNEIFNLVDHVILLAPGGRIAYSGSPSALCSHFSSLSFCCPLRTNIADFVMDVMSGFVCMRGDDTLHPVGVVLAYLCEWWEESQYPEFVRTYNLPTVLTHNHPAQTAATRTSAMQTEIELQGRLEEVDVQDGFEVEVEGKRKRRGTEGGAKENTAGRSRDLGPDSTLSVDTPLSRRGFTSMLFGQSSTSTSTSTSTRTVNGPLGSRCEESTCVDVERGNAKNWEKLGGLKIGQKRAPLLSLESDDVAVDKAIVPIKIRESEKGVEGEREGAKEDGRNGEKDAEESRGGEEGVERREIKAVGMGGKEGGLRYSIQDKRGQQLKQSGKEDSGADRYTESDTVCAHSAAHTAIKKVILFAANTSLKTDPSIAVDRAAPNTKMAALNKMEGAKSITSANGNKVSSVISSVVESVIVKRLRRIKSTFSVSFRRQFRLFNRSIGSVKSNCSILFALGAIIALLFGTVQISRYTGGGFAGQVSSMQLAFALLTMSSSLQLFGADSNIRRREEDGGIYIIPYYLGKLGGQSLELFVAPLAFLFGYYALATPGGSFTDYWLFTLLLYVTVMGLANFVAVIVPGKGKALIANGMIVILWSFGGLAPTSASLRTRLGLFGMIVNILSPFKRTFEFQMLAEFKTYSPAFGDQIDKYLTQFEYDRRDYNICIGWLLLHAVSSNVLAMLWLLWAKDHFKYWRVLSDSVKDRSKILLLRCKSKCRRERDEKIPLT